MVFIFRRPTPESRPNMGRQNHEWTTISDQTFISRLRLFFMFSACVVRGEIPAEEFALYEALSALSDVESELLIREDRVDRRPTHTKW